MMCERTFVALAGMANIRFKVTTHSPALRADFLMPSRLLQAGAYAVTPMTPHESSDVWRFRVMNPCSLESQVHDSRLG